MKGAKKAEMRGRKGKSWGRSTTKEEMKEEREEGRNENRKGRRGRNKMMAG